MAIIMWLILILEAIRHVLQFSYYKIAKRSKMQWKKSEKILMTRNAIRMSIKNHSNANLFAI